MAPMKTKWRAVAVPPTLIQQEEPPDPSVVPSNNRPIVSGMLCRLMCVVAVFLCHRNVLDLSELYGHCYNKR